MPLKKEITLKTIADELGLTVHTVSKALRGLPGMSESTRREVFRTARSLGYWSKALSDGLAAERIPMASGKPRRFALLIMNDSRLFRLQSEGLERRLHELGHAAQNLLFPGWCRREEELLEWAERAGLLHMDGLFLGPAIPEWVETAFLKLSVPVVIINYPPVEAAVDSVIWDVQHAVHISVDALYKQGHRSILYAGDTVKFRGFRLRWEAFLNASARLGLSLNPGEHLTEGTEDRGRWMGRLKTRLASGRYTAVIGGVSGEAEWIFGAAAALGLSVPEELSVVGIEDWEVLHRPGLSRPVLLIDESGERAAELMLRRLANPLSPYEHVRLLGPFVPGETMGPAKSEKKEL
ncbi:LacI family DNA-binding transcriptional regulator [Gorillibacterium sp. sgz5001074]|uniref:LacI family DNA-binding transcriptional regulator n=1 Tax=Gorillibacterium sp. sgz5001074 TaxID=3446695 RepID=UPI003F6715ED